MSEVLLQVRGQVLMCICKQHLVKLLRHRSAATRAAIGYIPVLTPGEILARRSDVLHRVLVGKSRVIQNMTPGWRLYMVYHFCHLPWQRLQRLCL